MRNLDDYVSDLLAVIQLGFIFLGVGAPCGKCVVDLCRFTPSENLFVHVKIGLFWEDMSLLISGGRWMSCAGTVLMHGDRPDDGPQRIRRGKKKLPQRYILAIGPLQQTEEMQY